ncbi:D-isomer specific 2-hydroxyacid dehydrogenase, NAD binding domain [Carpediemonas membranifera]|uniref:D-isomer specific 2-hydroxyacid dehydrogenase, NAD binding domain n=1 Tax=Carpediemonas membranifera TaxID=201153 RepID=A0A8J6E0H9_9EUKA|nr:D-isomer specific 2-hydroxyacid dehydrogenase, NAD binding domain [Carpediemonas membranifera]|eukprot:KAG9391871.1 D-isomer specific 2-hydroxyacid dehydrogenase, NAD binding domain [Carpediemonas membranifera]
MKIAFFGTKTFDRESFDHSNKKEDRFNFDIDYFDVALNSKTIPLAYGYQAVCVFVNDDLSAPILRELHAHGTSIVALRCAGYNNVDLSVAHELGMTVVHVPSYSPEAVAEHTVALMLTLNRKTHKAYQRTRDANFNLDGLVGFNLFGKTVGIVGTGRIGIAAARILRGFGMKLLVHDPYVNPAAEELGAEYVDLDTLFRQSDVITLHCPLFEANYHLLNAEAFAKMKKGVMVINTSRGALLNSVDAIEALKDGTIGALGLDVYEEESELFFQDKSNEVIPDDVFRRLSACHNVLFTGHQAFLTREALVAISETTLTNLAQVTSNEECPNVLRPRM